MKEKLDVSLDNRQIVSLLIAGIVVMGAVFVLGVVVGKKLAGNAQTAAAPDLLSALDANAQALQQARATESPLTFQDELTRRSGSEQPPPSKPTTVTVAMPPPPAPKPEPKPAEPAPEPASEPAPEPTATPEPLDAPVAVAQAPAPKPAPEPKPAAPEPKPAPTSGKVVPASVPTRTTSPESGLKEAFARASQRPTEAAPGGDFTLQISAFQSRSEADRFAARLRDRGYAPYILAAEVPRKGTWYRVRMGSFKTREAAARYLADFQRETHIQAFVAGAN
jgi:septal ring-binding cell division protein DamX